PLPSIAIWKKEPIGFGLTMLFSQTGLCQGKQEGQFNGFIPGFIVQKPLMEGMCPTGLSSTAYANRWNAHGHRNIDVCGTPSQTWGGPKILGGGHGPLDQGQARGELP